MMNHPEDKASLKLGWRVLIFLGGFGTIQVLLTVAVGLAAAAYFAVAGFDGTDDIGAWFQSPETRLHLLIATALPTMALGLAWVALCRKVFDRRPLLVLGLGRPAWGWLRTGVLGTLAGATPIVVCVLLLWAAEGLRPTGISTSLITWLLVPALLLMAFFEELVFRGYLLRNFLEEDRPVLGLLVTSLLFCLMHSFNPEIWSSLIGPLNLFGAGVLLALAYLVSGELWFPTALHFAWNFAQGVLFELPVSGLQTDGILDVEPTGAIAGWLTGEGFGLEASALMTGAEVVLIATFLAVLHRRAAPRWVGLPS